MKIPLEEVHITVDVKLRGYGVIFSYGISQNKLSQCLNWGRTRCMNVDSFNAPSSMCFFCLHLIIFNAPSS